MEQLAVASQTLSDLEPSGVAMERAGGGWRGGTHDMDASETFMRGRSRSSLRRELSSFSRLSLRSAMLCFLFLTSPPARISYGAGMPSMALETGTRSAAGGEAEAEGEGFRPGGWKLGAMNGEEVCGRGGTVEVNNVGGSDDDLQYSR